jgi:flagellin-specific chaperone FliS
LILIKKVILYKYYITFTGVIMGFVSDEKREFETQAIIDRAQKIISDFNEIIDVDEVMQLLDDLNTANESGNEEETNGLVDSLEELIEEIEDSIKK